MPTISLSFDVSDESSRKVGKWFPKWNASRPAPFDTFNDFLISVLRHQIKSLISTANAPETVLDEFRKADPAVQEQILQLLDLD